MTLDADSVNWRSSREEISYELLVEGESVVAVSDHPVVVDEEHCGRVSLLHMFVYLGSDVRVSSVLYIESVFSISLVNHLVDDVPGFYSQGVKMIQSVIQVLEHCGAELRPKQVRSPARL